MGKAVRSGLPLEALLLLEKRLFEPASKRELWCDSIHSVNQGCHLIRQAGLHVKINSAQVNSDHLFTEQRGFGVFDETRLDLI